MVRFPRLQRYVLMFSLIAMLGLPILVGQHEIAPTVTIPPGIKYEHQRDGEVPWSIHVVRIDRASEDFKYMATVATGKILGLATLTEQVGAINDDGWEPVAAINGDFFRIEDGPYQGDMLGLEITSGTLISSPWHDAFWIAPDGSPQIGPVSTKIHVTWPGNDVTTTTTFVAGLNGPRVKGRAVLFTPEFGDTTQTDDDGIEVVLAPADGEALQPLTVSTDADFRITKIHGDGDNDIRPGTMVLSIDEDMIGKLPTAVKGAVLHVRAHSTPDLTGVTTAIGGWPILVRNGQINPNADQAARHPRTAIGYNSKTVFIVVVDGRQSKLSVGMTMPELARFMQDLGATEALNMDGGGSSELWLDGQIMNSPSGGHERAVANALVVLKKK